MDFLPYAKQSIDADDVQAVAEALRSDWLTTGPKIQVFEEQLARRVGARYVVAFNSGTAALHAAYFAAGVQAGDEVVTSPITFAATANAACYLGARPVFVDVKEDTANIDPGKIVPAITSRTRVIAPVDFTGQPADLHPIMEIAGKRRLVVVEDAAHALGAFYHKRPVGSIADMTVFSFHPVKQITTGEGGAVATDSEEYYQRLLIFRNHGITRDETMMTENHGPWYYEMRFLGYNYRITDIQCALGTSQLKKLDSFLQRRKELVRLYDQKLGDHHGLRLPVTLPGREPAWHLYAVRLTGEFPRRREVFETLRDRGIGAQVHYLPVYWHPYYRQMGYRPGLCPVAEDYYDRCLSLPLFPAMSDADVDRVADELKRAIGKVSV